MSVDYFFIYGPLTEGGYGHSSLPLGSKKLTTVSFPYKSYQTPFGYPAMLNEPGNTKGELYQVPKGSSGAIDSYLGYYGPKNPKNYFERKKGTFRSFEVFFYFASNETAEIAKAYGLEIPNGDWLTFYNTEWKEFESNHDSNVNASQFTEEELVEVCEDFGADSIQEVNVILESIYRRNIILEAEDRKKKENPMEEPSLDDLNEPEEDNAVLNVKDDEPEEEPSLDDLTEPPEGDEPKDIQVDQPEDKSTVEPPVEPTKPNIPPPQPPTIPSKKELDPVEKEEEPSTSIDWKREKHLRTLYNNFFKVFPSRGTSTKVAVKFTSVKADSLHPDNKYLQANITSICSSEDIDDKNHINKYYGQWIQLRRQRNTQPWTVDLPCEVRCECKSFIYYLAYANIRNKSFAGTPVRKGSKDGKPINYTIPSNQNNPGYVPALCKHLLGLTNEIFNVNGDGKVKSNLVV